MTYIFDEKYPFQRLVGASILPSTTMGNPGSATDQDGALVALLCIIEYRCHLRTSSGVDQGFPIGGMDLFLGGCAPATWHFSVKMYVKTK